MKKMGLSLTFILLLLIPLAKVFSQNQFWELVSFPGQDVSQLEIDRQNNFYASAQNKLFKSSDGISWEIIFSPNQYSYTWPLKILIDTTNSNFDKIYILKQNASGTYPDSLFYSTNCGESWENYPLPPDLNPAYKLKGIAYKANGDLYIVNNIKLQYTTDNGNTWELLVDGESVGWDMHRVQIDIQGNIYTDDYGFWPYGGGYFEDVYKSANNGQTWQLDISSYGTGIEFSNFETLPSGEVYTGYFSSLFFKKSPDQNWITINNSIGPRSMAINKYKYIYIVKYFGNVIPSRYSPDYGLHWFEFDDGTLTINDLLLDNQGFLYAATSTGIYKSIASTFPIVSEFFVGFPETPILDTTSQEINIFNPYNSQLIVDSVSLNSENFQFSLATPIVLEPGDSELVNLYFIPTAWGSYNDTLIIYSNLITQCVILSGDSPAPELVTNPPQPFVLFGQTIIDSTKTKTVKIINHSINLLEIDSIYTHKSQFNFTSFDYPVYIASDSLNLDISFTPDSNLNYIDTLFILDNLTSSPYLIRLTGRGVQPVSTINEGKESYRFELYDNYPNPFNPTTKIKYQLPELSNVKLTVYDVLGRQIKTLVNEEKTAGTYEVEFDGTDLTSGVYFYRIEAGSFSSTKKFILMK